ncbi:MAG: minor capsid protein [Defluviitaleaceae bacterium]|nr:minor capsid protein [Defluviitaleaceae bacterium]
MLSLHILREIVKTRVQLDNISLHTILNNLSKTAALYIRQGRGRATHPMAGAGMAGYDMLPATILLRCGTDADEAEEAANSTYKALCRFNFESTKGYRGFVMATSQGAVPLGKDQRGVFEYTIDLDVFYYEEE